MSIDKFGRSLKSSYKGARGPKGEGYSLTSEGDYDIQNKRLCNVRDPKADGEAINLRTLNKKAVVLEGTNYSAKDKQIQNLATPLHDTDAATKEYVDSLCKTQNKPITTLLAKHTADITDLSTRMAKSEGHIADNRQFHEKELRKFGMYIFNYIHRKTTGRAVILPSGANGDYLDWWELFKLPESVQASETTGRIDIPLDSETLEFIRNKDKTLNQN